MSNRLWGIARPPHLREPDETQQMFAWVVATNGSRWLVVDTNFTIPIHVDAELDGIADILQPYIDAGHMPSDTNAILAAFVESKRGQDLVVYEAFPAFFKAASKTMEEMQSLGLLPVPSP